MDLFKKMFGSGDPKCPMCEGKGTLAAPDKGLELRLGESPSKLTSEEMALVMVHASKLEELSRKLGVDPYAVKVSLDFKNTGHHMCFTVARNPKPQG